MTKIKRQPGPPLPGRDSELSPEFEKSLKRSRESSRELSQALKRAPARGGAGQANSG